MTSLLLFCWRPFLRVRMERKKTRTSAADEGYVKRVPATISAFYRETVLRRQLKKWRQSVTGVAIWNGREQGEHREDSGEGNSFRGPSAWIRRSGSLGHGSRRSHIYCEHRKF